VVYLPKAERTFVPFLKKPRTRKVENCADKGDTILQLGFMAAEQGFNALIQPK